MCTLSIITGSNGYLLAMNRDERISRPPASPPEIFDTEHGRAIYPRDSSGGTWIAANDHGVSFALLNANSSLQLIDGFQKTQSRGFVILQLLQCSTLEQFEVILHRSKLEGTPPFRLVAVSSQELGIGEWRWNYRSLCMRSHDWTPQHFYSSSLSDHGATQQRGAITETAWKDPEAGSMPWLRRLHGSHENGPGPFSLCVHREEVKTISYTELVVSPDNLTMTYFPDSPCQWGALPNFAAMPTTLQLPFYHVNSSVPD